MNVVIIGGGFAGSTVARMLEKEFDVTLIDAKDYFEFTPSILRTIVEPEHMKKIQVLHKKYLKKARVIIGHVTDLTRKEVEVNKEKIKYDYVVIASGSGYSVPIKEEDIVITTRASHLKEHHERLVHAKEVIIAGGGLVGVELAAEISEDYPEKKITIVHAKERLIERNPKKASGYVEKYFRKRNVEIIYNERVIEKKNKCIETDKKRKLEADLVFWCTGIVPHFEFLKKHFKDFLNERDQIKVNEFLQVNEKMFAAGDINDIHQEKTAQNANYQGVTVARNIKALAKGEQLNKFIPSVTPMTISLGKYKGVIVYKSFVWTGFFPAVVKWVVEKKEMFKFR